jgi:hypothetical protein
VRRGEDAPIIEQATARGMLLMGDSQPSCAEQAERPGAVGALVGCQQPIGPLRALGLATGEPGLAAGAQQAQSGLGVVLGGPGDRQAQVRQLFG